MTPQEAAEWMFAELQRVRWLDQETVAWQFLKLDKTLVHTNANGNPAIEKKVLDAFKKLTPTADYVWSRGSRHWRKREHYDTPGKRMQD